MNIEKLKELSELYSRYECLTYQIGVEQETINRATERLRNLTSNLEGLEVEINLSTDSSHENDDEILEMGTAFHRKVEATISENGIDRDRLKEYLGISSMRNITIGQARNFLDNVQLYKDLIYR
jgi:hypothetical protein